MSTGVPALTRTGSFLSVISEPGIPLGVCVHEPLHTDLVYSDAVLAILNNPVLTLMQRSLKLNVIVYTVVL